jgi:hypothetical protein
MLSLIIAIRAAYPIAGSEGQEDEDRGHISAGTADLK